MRAFACTSSIGPGATNMVTGAATATVNRIPVLLLPGDIFATRRVTPVLQQLERHESQDVSVNDAFRPVSRYWDRIDRPEQLVTALPAAFRVLTSPSETGAVTVCLPQDVQAEASDFPDAMFEERTWVVPRTRPDTTLLERAADAIADAHRPMIVAGEGIRSRTPRQHWTCSPAGSASRSPRRRPARGRCPGTIRSSWGRSG